MSVISLVNMLCIVCTKFNICMEFQVDVLLSMVQVVCLFQEIDELHDMWEFVSLSVFCMIVVV